MQEVVGMNVKMAKVIYHYLVMSMKFSDDAAIILYRVFELNKMTRIS